MGVPAVLPLTTRCRMGPFGGILRAVSALSRDEAGEEQMEYILILALVIVPMVVAARLMWAVLLHYYTLGAFVIDSPLF